MSSQTHLGRSNWLEAGLDSLYEEGEAGVRVEALARRLGVTKGSFYHHFRDRAELLRGMIDRWRAAQEALVEAREASPSGSPIDRIAELIRFTQRKDSRHDVARRDGQSELVRFFRD